jgi:hypothetical protein
MRTPSIDLFAAPPHRCPPAIVRILWPITLTLTLAFNLIHTALLSLGPALHAVGRLEGHRHRAMGKSAEPPCAREDECCWTSSFGAIVVNGSLYLTAGV